MTTHRSSDWDQAVDVVVVGSGDGNPTGTSMLFSHFAALHIAGRPAPADHKTG